MLSKTYFLAKFRFDTAENEPAKNLQNVLKTNFAAQVLRRRALPGDVEGVPGAAPAHSVERDAKWGQSLVTTDLRRVGFIGF